VRVLLDYRPALRDRSGAGEYVHELAGALAATADPDHRIELFTSSWKDRPHPQLAADAPGVAVHDRRVPVRVLNWWWHRAGVPRIERLVRGPFDVVHAAHPLLIPTVGAGVVTIHDLDFLDHPERTGAEVRRDYSPLVQKHAMRADGILTSSEHSAQRIVEKLSIPREHVVVAPPGPPRWTAGGRRTPRNPLGYVLFVGTLEPRKNLGSLLDAYTLLRAQGRDIPPLKVAGRAPASAAPWLRRMKEPPLAGSVDYVGYVPDADRRALFEGASLLVLPSWHEGFGLPVLEAMALGVPVVTSNRGALPEVAGDAGLLVAPDDPGAIADAIRRLLGPDGLAEACVRLGLGRAATLSWSQSAHTVWGLYADAARRHLRRRAHRR
jgi:glycosyltransferase involved in cell wall biosynthesis